MRMPIAASTWTLWWRACTRVYPFIMQVVAKHENANSREYLDSLVESMHKILKMLDAAPSVQFQVSRIKLGILPSSAF